MEKRELYDLLIEDGAKLRPMNFYTIEALKETYFERFGKHPDDDADNNNDDEQQFIPDDEKINNGDDEIKTLLFDRGGWCKELKKSYAMGIYRPKDYEEYSILKKYAKAEL